MIAMRFIFRYSYLERLAQVSGRFSAQNDAVVSQEISRSA
jgi:hypothetical protein